MKVVVVVGGGDSKDLTSDEEGAQRESKERE